MTGSPFERTRSEDCLSDLAIDRLVGERETSPHLEVCDACAARFRELGAARDRFVLPLPRKRSSRRWPAGLAAVLAAGIAALIYWPQGQDHGLRIKGGPKLSFYVKHGEAVRRGSDGDAVAPRDSIRFAYSADQPYHLAVLSVDPKGVVSVYYPEGDRTHLETAGADVALPLSTVLDESHGRERIFALFCEQAIDLEGMRRALESSGEVARQDGCHADRVEWIKQ